MRPTVVLVLLTSLAAVCAAVTPVVTVHTTEADFFDGQFNGTVVDSRGRLQLAPELDVVLKSDDSPPVVLAAGWHEGNLFIGSGTDGSVWKLTNGQAGKFAQLPTTMVTSLLVSKNEILAAGAGRRGGIWRIGADGTVQPLWVPEKVQYVWDLAVGADGAVYAAAGNPASLWKIDAGGNARALLEPDAKLAGNLLCLALADKGIYVGGDKEGLVWKVDLVNGNGRVIFDAAENEIASLVVDQAGGIYVATSDASRASAEAADAPRDVKPGRSAPAPQGDGQDEDPKDTANSEPAAEKRQQGGAESGEGPGQGQGPSPKPPTTRGSPNGPGNAVYYIRPDGLVEAIFRRPVTILDMTRRDGRLVLATGHGGRIYQVTTDGDVVSVLADTEAKQVTALAAGPEGKLAFVTASPGSAGVIVAALAEAGTYESKPIDAGQPARFGAGRILADIPDGASVLLTARSGNLESAEAGAWSDWSDPIQVTSGRYFQIPAPTGRFLQYRIRLMAGPAGPPGVERIELAHQVANLAPAISSLTVKPTNKHSGPPEPSQVYRVLEIEAKDANQDRLEYTVQMRSYLEKGPWLQVAKGQTQGRYVWDTRGTADGIYHLRVVVTDAPSNPAGAARQAVRISEPVAVDNTAPEVSELVARLQEGAASVQGKIADKLSRIVSIAYAVDSQEEWTVVQAADGILDSPAEAFEFQTDRLDPGAHRIAVKVVDALGNVGYGTVLVDVPE